jgi:hypothetical protein
MKGARHLSDEEPGTLPLTMCARDEEPGTFKIAGLSQVIHFFLCSASQIKNVSIRNVLKTQFVDRSYTVRKLTTV